MTGTSSVFQFYDSPRQLICFWRTFFRLREADLLKSSKLCPWSAKTARIVKPYTSCSSERHTVLHTLWGNVEHLTIFLCCCFLKILPSCSGFSLVSKSSGHEHCILACDGQLSQQYQQTLEDLKSMILNHDFKSNFA
jgi:hypothetical protein